jgi:hypothetical protein
MSGPWPTVALVFFPVGIVAALAVYVVVGAWLP